jgi:hypothetical protein
MLVTADPFSWEILLRRPPDERRAAAPPELVAHLRRHQETGGKPASARPCAGEDPDLNADVDSAIAGLPAPVLHHLAPWLLGVFTLEGTGASATSGVVAGPEGELIGAFIAIDTAAFAGAGANAWFEARENMPFAPSAGLRLAACIAEPEHDHRIAALQYALLHEAGHVLAACKALAPVWWRPAATSAPAYPLLDPCWRAAPHGRYMPRRGHDFPQRAQLVYHGVPRLSLRDAAAAYGALGRTGFPTLYAATSIYEDIADSFAGYVHVHLMGRPLQHRLLEGGAASLVAEGGAYWQGEHGMRRAALFENLLAGSPG